MSAINTTENVENKPLHEVNRKYKKRKVVLINQYGIVLEFSNTAEAVEYVKKEQNLTSSNSNILMILRRVAKKEAKSAWGYSVYIEGVNL